VLHHVDGKGASSLAFSHERPSTQYQMLGKVEDRKMYSQHIHYDALEKGALLLWLLFCINAPLRSVKAEGIRGDKNIRARVVRPFA